MLNERFLIQRLSFLWKIWVWIFCDIFFSGYDDENGSYLRALHDHLVYRYEVLEVLGKGSFGQVVKALDHKTGQHVAVKIIRNKKRYETITCARYRNKWMVIWAFMPRWMEMVYLFHVRILDLLVLVFALKVFFRFLQSSSILKKKNTTLQIIIRFGMSLCPRLIKKEVK